MLTNLWKMGGELLSFLLYLYNVPMICKRFRFTEIFLPGVVSLSVSSMM